MTAHLFVLERDVEEALRAYNTASPSKRGKLKEALALARAALDDAQKEQER